MKWVNLDELLFFNKVNLSVKKIKDMKLALYIRNVLNLWELGYFVAKWLFGNATHILL